MATFLSQLGLQKPQSWFPSHTTSPFLTYQEKKKPNSPETKVSIFSTFKNSIGREFKLSVRVTYSISSIQSLTPQKKIRSLSLIILLYQLLLYLIAETICTFWSSSLNGLVDVRLFSLSQLTPSFRFEMFLWVVI